MRRLMRKSQCDRSVSELHTSASVLLAASKMAQKCLVMDEELFAINPVAKEATCLVCKKKLTDLRKFSYHRHYKSQHKAIAIRFGIVEEDAGQDEPSRKLARLDIRMDTPTYVSSLVELVTVNGLPLRFLKYPAFQRICRPIEDSLHIVRHLNPDSMRVVSIIICAL